MKPARIVLIEDHQLFRDLLIAVLQGNPDFVIAGDFNAAAKGVQGCLELHPDLVIVDWMLPDGKAIDVVSALLPKLPGTRFIFLSSVEKEHIVREAIDAGVQGFVMKRASYETLLEAVREVVAGRSYYCTVSSRLLIEAMRTAANAGPNALTPRERDILRGVARGESLKAIAHRSKTSPKTVNNQFSALKVKLEIYETVGLVRYAIRHGIVDEL